MQVHGRVAGKAREFYDDAVRLSSFRGGCVEDASTALVKLTAADVWSGAKDVVVSLRRKHHFERVDTDLDQPHINDADPKSQEALIKQSAR